MNINDWLALAVICVCLLLSASFRGSETALTAFSRARMLRLEKQGNRSAGIVNRLLETRERLIGAMLFGNNVGQHRRLRACDRRAARLVRRRRRALRHRGHDLVVVVFAEVLPKTAAINAPDRIALIVARPIDWAVRLFGPLLVGVESDGALDPAAVRDPRRQRPVDPVGARGAARRGRSHAPRGQRREA